MSIGPIHTHIVGSLRLRLPKSDFAPVLLQVSTVQLTGVFPKTPVNLCYKEASVVFSFDSSRKALSHLTGINLVQIETTRKTLTSDKTIQELLRQ